MTLCKRVFKKEWKDFTTNQVIAFSILVLTLLGAASGVCVWIWPHSGTGTTIVESGGTIISADANSVAQNVGGQGNVTQGPGATYIDNRGVDSHWLANQYADTAKELGRAEVMLAQSEQDNEQLRKEREDALKRVAELEARGNRPDATEAIRQYRESGDSAKLLEILIQEEAHHRGEQTYHRDERMKLNREIAAVAYLKGNIEVASQAVVEMLAIEPNDLSAIIQSGNIRLLQGRLAEAESDYLKASRLAKDDGQRAVALGNLGVVYQTRGELDRAEEMHREALKINERLGRAEGVAGNYGNLGNIYAIRGEFNQAEQWYRKGLQIDEKIGRFEGLAGGYANLGTIHSARGEWDQAEQMSRKALDIYEKLGSLVGIAAQYGNLGLVCANRGQLEKGEQLFRKALGTYEKVGSLDGTAHQYGNLGVVFKSRGDLVQAEQMFRKALDTYKELGSLEGIAKQYVNLGLVHLARGELDLAERTHSQALEIYEKIGSRSGKATACGSLGLVYLARKDLNRSREYLQKSVELFEQAGLQSVADRIRPLLVTLERKSKEVK